MNFFCLLVATLATFRLSVMFSKEAGPGRVFRKLRGKTQPGSALREGITCTLCESIWWSAAITVALGYEGLIEWPFAPFYCLAASGGAVILNQAFTRDL